ncbi:hypothetical protein LEN26_012759 [Aphanomyces euteiches]|nr:hypothetical protein AeMF1_017947 [Aphanomyces euteiches]KAH9117175.1 hypothetical protein LEN26_012759 [Aphanomyces euteiches]KAH9189657.1 hypothetical protein AeNC1_008358 [Aphanomyces euteiches]
MSNTMSGATTCYFNDCNNQVLPGSWKCIFHRHRARCLMDNCQNQVYARNLCVRHGGKKQCEFAGCTLNARLGNVCSKHGAGDMKKRCTHEGCTKQAHERQKCVRHGGGRKCKMHGCQTHARSGGFCSRHSRLFLLEQTNHNSSTRSIPREPAPCEVDKSASGGLNVVNIETTATFMDMLIADCENFPTTIELPSVDAATGYVGHHAPDERPHHHTFPLPPLRKEEPPRAGPSSMYHMPYDEMYPLKLRAPTTHEVHLSTADVLSLFDSL